MLLLLRRMNDATRLQQTRFTDLLPSSQSSPIHAPQTDRKIPRARQIREKDEFAQSVFRPFPLLKYCPSHIKCSGNLTPCRRLIFLSWVPFTPSRRGFFLLSVTLSACREKYPEGGGISREKSPAILNRSSVSVSGRVSRRIRTRRRHYSPPFPSCAVISQR